MQPELVANLKLDGKVGHFEIGLEMLMSNSSVRQFAGLHRFPTIRRDVSILVPVGTTWQAVQEGALPDRLEFVSDYYGDELPAGQKVMTVRLEIADANRTPTEAEANDRESKLIAVLQRKLSARRRDDAS